MDELFDFILGFLLILVVIAIAAALFSPNVTGTLTDPGEPRVDVPNEMLF